MQLPTNEYGVGSVLVVLHGLFGSRDNWHTVAMKLADIRRVVTLDLPNHGEAPHTPSFDYDVMADTVAESMTAMGVARYDVLGHSMGGKAAMRLCQRHPTHVNRLIVADIAPVNYPTHSHAAIIRGIRAVDLSTVRSRRDADGQMAASIPNETIRSFLLKNLVRNGAAYSWRLNIDAIESNYSAIRGYPSDGASFSGPSLFLRGERSDYVGRREQEAIESLFPAADILTIDGAGHWLHAEKQEEFVEGVRSFLSG